MLLDIVCHLRLCGRVQRILPPRSLKLNGHVEFFNTAIVVEFLNFWSLSVDPDELG